MHRDSDSKPNAGITKHGVLGALGEYRCDVHFTKDGRPSRLLCSECLSPANGVRPRRWGPEVVKGFAPCVLGYVLQRWPMIGSELMLAFREFKAAWDPDNKMNPHKVVEPYLPTENLRVRNRLQARRSCHVFPVSR